MSMRHYFICVLCITASLLAGCRDVFTGAWDDMDTSTSKNIFAQTVTPISASSGSTQFNSVAVDSKGNTYAVGYVYGDGTFNFGGSSTEFNGAYSSGNNAVIVKYNASGSAEWARSVSPDTNINESQFNSVAVDSDGNAYAVGYVVGGSTVASYNFGNGIQVSGKYSGYCVVIVKFNTSGTALWAKSLTSATGESKFYDIAVYSNNDVYAVGTITGGGSEIFDFGNSIVINSSNHPGLYNDINAVIVKYAASDGTVQWAKSLTSATGESIFNGVAVDSSNYVYAVGYIMGGSTGIFSFGGSASPTPPASSSNAVIVKYNESGDAQWAYCADEASSSSTFNDIAIDSANNIYVVGDFFGSLDFGSYNTTVTGQAGYRNALMVNYNTSGQAQWASTVKSASGHNYFSNVATDYAGNIYAVGYVLDNGWFNFGGSTVPFKGVVPDGSAIIVKFNASGTAQCATTLSSASSESVFFGVAASNVGNVYAVGYVSGTGSFNFGGNTTPFSCVFNGYNAVIVKYY